MVFRSGMVNFNLPWTAANDTATFPCSTALSQMLLARLVSVMLIWLWHMSHSHPPCLPYCIWRAQSKGACHCKKRIMYSFAAKNARWQRTGFRKYVPTSSYCISNIAILYTSLSIVQNFTENHDISRPVRQTPPYAVISSVRSIIYTRQII